MKNTLSITSDCVCTCVDSIADGTNRIFVALNVGNVSAPLLKIWLGDVLKNTIVLGANKLNSVEIPTALFVANGVVKFQYSDADYTGQIFNINFPNKLDGNLSVKMQSDYVYSAKYTVIGGSGSVDPYILPPAKTDTLGGIMVGDNLAIDESGRLSATAAPDPYTLPAATAASLGGVIVGDNLTVEKNGRVSAPAPYELPTAGANTLGGVKVGSGLQMKGDVLQTSLGLGKCETIWSGLTELDTSWHDLTLAKSIDNYDYLIVSYWNLASSGGCEQAGYMLIPKIDFYLSSTYPGEEDYTFFCGDNVSAQSTGITFRIKDKNTLTYKNVTNVSGFKTAIRAIYGIKSPRSQFEYSTDEQIVGTWQDKPLYQKTFFGVQIAQNQENFVSDNFGNNTIRHFQIDFTGVSNNLTSSNSFSDTLFINANNQLIYYFFRNGTWWAGFNTADITVQYTKTTD